MHNDRETDLFLQRSGSGSGEESLQWDIHEFRIGVEELLRGMFMALTN